MDFSSEENRVPMLWEVGQCILNTYKVKAIHEGGGMGLVYRVHHQNWNMDLAVKSPRPQFFDTEQQKQNFSKECETWIGLGLHPHIVCCFYVRTLGGIPRVFAEYIEGGSLRDWIQSGKLYEGSPRAVLMRVLDIAIQMAWGLHHAHEQGVVHQDVKPANVLMEPSGTAKITDFGLAKARSATGETKQADSNRSIVVSTGGLTPAYCSPEQASGAPLTRRTDIWSWAVSVLEMLLGKLFWHRGQFAATAASRFAEIYNGQCGSLRMVSEFRDILVACLRIDPGARPHDFLIVAEQLIALYVKIGDAPFRRTLPTKQDLDADSANNHVVSLIDLGYIAQPASQNAYNFLRKLLTGRPDHFQGRINKALLDWNNLRISIFELNRRLDNIYSSPFVSVPEEWAVSLELSKLDARRAKARLEGCKGEHRESLSTQIARQHANMRILLGTFFRDPENLPPPPFRDRLLSQLRHPTGVSNEVHAEQHGRCAFSSADAGIMASRTPVDQQDPSNGVRLSIFDTRENRLIHQFTAPTTGRLALSENGKFLVVVLRKDLPFDEIRDCGRPEREYHIAVYNTNDGHQRGYIVEKLDAGYSLAAVTIDDQCLCLSLWLEECSGLVEKGYALLDNAITPFRCDFRKPSYIGRFDDVFVSGDRRLLLAVTGSRCSLWRYPSPSCDDAVNIADIDLRDFGLIDTETHLPGFDLAQGFEYRIDGWNAHRFMRLLDQMPHQGHPGYLLCRPTDTQRTFLKSNACAAALQAANDSEHGGNLKECVRFLNRYCAQLGAYEEPIMKRRHALACSIEQVHVETAWHHRTEDWYWESSVHGLQPAGSDSVALQWFGKFDKRRLPDMMNRYDESEIHHAFWTQRPFGVSNCGDDGGLFFLLNNKAQSSTNSLVRTNASKHCDTPKWSMALADSSGNPRARFRKIAMNKSFAYTEIQPGVVAAINLETGRIYFQAVVGSGLDFLKIVKAPSGQDVLFAAIRPRGCRILDLELNPLIELAPLEHLVRDIGPLDDVAGDLSVAVGWIGEFRLVCINFRELQTIELWNPFEICGESPPESYGHGKPCDVTMTFCGKAIACRLWPYLYVIDVVNRRVAFRWRHPVQEDSTFSFDGSGRWLVFAHAGNQFEVFQLLWNEKYQTWNRREEEAHISEI